MTKQVYFNTIAIIILLCFWAFLVGALAWDRHNKYLSDLELANYNTLKYKIELIKSYQQYYKSTETLLDSMHINENANILTRSVGLKYLESKSTVDSLANLEY